MRPSILSESSVGILSRNEMKNILAGGCDWNGCSGSSAVFNCWYGECTATYSGQDAIDCVNQVGETQQYAIAMCGTNYS